MASPLLLAGQNASMNRRVVDAVTNFSVPCLLSTSRPPTTLPTCSIDSPMPRARSSGQPWREARTSYEGARARRLRSRPRAPRPRTRTRAETRSCRRLRRALRLAAARPLLHARLAECCSGRLGRGPRRMARWLRTRARPGRRPSRRLGRVLGMVTVSLRMCTQLRARPARRSRALRWRGRPRRIRDRCTGSCGMSWVAARRACKDRRVRQMRSDVLKLLSGMSRASSPI